MENSHFTDLDKSKPIMSYNKSYRFILIQNFDNTYDWFNVERGCMNSDIHWKTIDDALNHYSNNEYKFKNVSIKIEED